jgi:hypothetical protein
MKGLSETMYIIIAVIVILIVALVVLTIFSNVPTSVSTIADARNNCRLTAESSCAATGTLPVTWSTPSHRTDQGIIACSDSRLLGPSCACDGRSFVC